MLFCHFRCVMMIGMPYPNIKSPELKEKMDYLNANFVSKKLPAFNGPRSAVGSESDCRSRGHEVNPGPVQYFVEIDNEMGLVVRKPVFGVSDKASFKQVSSATETS